MRSREQDAPKVLDGTVDAALEIGGRLEEIAARANLLRLSLMIESAKVGRSPEHVFGLERRLEELSRLISDAVGCTERLISDVAMDKSRLH